MTAHWMELDRAELRALIRTAVRLHHQPIMKKQIVELEGLWIPRYENAVMRGKAFKLTLKDLFKMLDGAA